MKKIETNRSKSAVNNVETPFYFVSSKLEKMKREHKITDIDK